MVKISQKVVDAVLKIINSDGDANTISDEENNKLAELLSNTKNKRDAEFIQGFMIELENKPKPAEEKTVIDEEESQPPEEKTVIDEEKEPEPKPEPKNPPSTKNRQNTISNNTVINDNGNKQSGMTNVNAKNGSTVFINYGTPPAVGYTGAPIPPNTGGGDISETAPEYSSGMPDNEVNAPEQLRDLSPEEIKLARDRGAEVADLLLGYTTGTEQYRAEKVLDKVDSENVIEFLRGFEEKLAEEKDFTKISFKVGRDTYDHFFEQMLTEYNFPEKQQLIHDIANKLEEHFKMKYGADADIAKEVKVVSLNKTLDKENAKKLDELALKEIKDTNVLNN
jgi:hypothetical protein